MRSTPSPLQSNRRSFSLALTLALGFMGFSGEALAAPVKKSSLLSHFDHEMHNKKVFGPEGKGCESCHTFSIDKKTGRMVPEDALKESSYKKDFKTICHSCHVAAESETRNASQACFTCHQSLENFRAITPQNHTNIAWASSHGTNARIDGASCANCHMTSECAKCHLRRNDVELKNHSRNYRFTHSVVARMQPHTCDSCHARSFCVDCHLGGK